MPPLQQPPSDHVVTEEIDHVNRLPDDVLLHILNHISSDIKALGRCSTISRRFRLLVPLVPSVVIHLNFFIFIRFPLFPIFIRSLISRILFKPFQPLGINSSIPRFPSSPSVRYRTPISVLKNFSNLRTLRIDFPSDELSFKDFPILASSSTLLRWRAHFGSSLDRCLILAAAASSSSAQTLSPGPARKDNESAVVADYDTITDSVYEKLAMTWTTTSLFAASARHHRFQPIIAEHMNLESLVLTDANGQGVLCMDRDQLEELRKKPILASSASLQRTIIPAHRMWEWYAPVVELSCGVVLKGATLIAVLPRPSNGGEKGKKDDVGLGWIEEEFDGEGMYAEAVRMLVKQGTTHYVEMDSF